MNDCTHLNVKQGQEGALICEDCEHIIFNPQLPELPEVPKPPKKKKAETPQEALENKLEEMHEQNKRIENLLNIILENTTKKKTKKGSVNE